MIVWGLRCLCMVFVFLSRSDALNATNRQDQVFNITALKVILSTIIIDYFVIQLLSEPDKHVAYLFKRQLLLILSRTQN